MSVGMFDFQNAWKKLRDLIASNIPYLTDTALESIDELNKIHEEEVRMLRRTKEYLDKRVTDLGTQNVALQELANKVVVNRRPPTVATAMNRTIFERNKYETELHELQAQVNILKSNAAGRTEEDEQIIKDLQRENKIQDQEIERLNKVVGNRIKAIDYDILREKNSQLEIANERLTGRFRDYDSDNAMLRRQNKGLIEEVEFLTKEVAKRGQRIFELEQIVEMHLSNKKLEPNKNGPVVGDLFKGYYHQGETKGVYFRVPYQQNILDLMETINLAAREAYPQTIIEVLKEKFKL